jgi:hypothetical protein
MVDTSVWEEGGCKDGVYSNNTYTDELWEGIKAIIGSIDDNVTCNCLEFVLLFLGVIKVEGPNTQKNFT